MIMLLFRVITKKMTKNVYIIKEKKQNKRVFNKMLYSVHHKTIIERGLKSVRWPNKKSLAHISP